MGGSLLEKRIILVLCVLLLTNCSLHWKNDSGTYQHMGMLRYTLTQTARVRFFEMQTFGLQIRLQAEDSGINLGYRKYIAIQPPNETNQQGQEINSGFFSNEETVSNNATLLFRRQFGFEAGSGLLINGATIGYDRTVIIEGPPNNVSTIKKIDFFEDNPARTTVYQSKGLNLQ